MKGKFKKIAYILLLAITVCTLSALSACNKNPYAKNNDFQVKVTNGEDALVYSPRDFTPTYGVLFYVGALVEPKDYAYLAEALARQGYLTVIPKYMSYTGFKEVEPIFEEYPDVRFFVAGHDLGGGAAVRRAQQNPYKVAGVILLSPVFTPRIIMDENGRPSKDEDGNWLYYVDEISGIGLRTLWIEASDATRTDEVIEDVKTHLNMATVTSHMLENSSTVCFSTLGTALSEEQRQAQQSATVRYTLSFLKYCVG